MRSIHPFAFLALAAMATRPAGAQTVATVPRSAIQELRAGDAVKIVVWRSQELSGDVAVGADGYLVHPLYQAIKVTGIPTDSVEGRVRQFLLKYAQDPQLVVEPELRIAVNGEVRNPNQYLVPRETTIGGAIALAGGPTERSNFSDTKLIRDKKALKIDLTDPASPWVNERVHSGDGILVGRSTNFWSTVFVPIVTTLAAVASIYSIVHNTTAH